MASKNDKSHRRSASSSIGGAAHVSPQQLSKAATLMEKLQQPENAANTRQVAKARQVMTLLQQQQQQSPTGQQPARPSTSGGRPAAVSRPTSSGGRPAAQQQLLERPSTPSKADGGGRISASAGSGGSGGSGSGRGGSGSAFSAAGRSMSCSGRGSPLTPPGMHGAGSPGFDDRQGASGGSKGGGVSGRSFRRQNSTEGERPPRGTPPPGGSAGRAGREREGRRRGSDEEGGAERIGAEEYEERGMGADGYAEGMGERGEEWDEGEEGEGARNRRPKEGRGSMQGDDSRDIYGTRSADSAANLRDRGLPPKAGESDFESSQGKHARR
ncbi:unnamed protein product [Closterium sp. Naga37s-1]|nr:unnamed protein product [Closterium sp. Naga37s-1]